MAKKTITQRNTFKLKKKKSFTSEDGYVKDEAQKHASTTLIAFQFSGGQQYF